MVTDRGKSYEADELSEVDQQKPRVTHQGPVSITTPDKTQPANLSRCAVCGHENRWINPFYGLPRRKRHENRGVGGGVANSGTLTVNNSTVSANSGARAPVAWACLEPNRICRNDPKRPQLEIAGPGDLVREERAAKLRIASFGLGHTWTPVTCSMIRSSHVVTLSASRLAREQ
jgi:hypothetical protein